ncbi:SCO2322 family protein [Streptomyces sp. NPDC058373]|uniref:SCO2322 family protein n=1 Tax=Streptomyces sp. NPDC058373 TaxID=3346465 RepID=UPI0036682CB4
MTPGSAASRPARRTLRAGFALLLGLLLALLVAAPAQAAGYRYWSFWEREGSTWSYATQGPTQALPGDGSVQGFRFAVSAEADDSAAPRAKAGFAEICAATEERAGRKRVALVIDFGTAADAPEGERPPKPRTACASVAEEASAADALAAVAPPLRYDSSAMLCAIVGYPEAGCGEQVSGSGEPSAEGTSEAASPEAGEPESGADSGSGPGGPSAGLLVGAGAVAVLGAAAVWQSRRRRG